MKKLASRICRTAEEVRNQERNDSFCILSNSLEAPTPPAIESSNARESVYCNFTLFSLSLTPASIFSTPRALSRFPISCVVCCSTFATYN